MVFPCCLLLFLCVLNVEGEWNTPRIPTFGRLRGLSPTIHREKHLSRDLVENHRRLNVFCSNDHRKVASSIPP